MNRQIDAILEYNLILIGLGEDKTIMEAKSVFIKNGSYTNIENGGTACVLRDHGALQASGWPGGEKEWWLYQCKKWRLYLCSKRSWTTA